MQRMITAIKHGSIYILAHPNVPDMHNNYKKNTDWFMLQSYEQMHLKVKHQFKNMSIKETWIPSTKQTILFHHNKHHWPWLWMVYF